MTDNIVDLSTERAKRKPVKVTSEYDDEAGKPVETVHVDCDPGDETTD